MKCKKKKGPYKLTPLDVFLRGLFLTENKVASRHDYNVLQHKVDVHYEYFRRFQPFFDNYSMRIFKW